MTAGRCRGRRFCARTLLAAERPKKLQPAAVLAPRAQLQPLAERPEEAAATVLAHEAKLQPLAEMMPEKLRQQQHWARANAHRHRVDQ